MARAVVVNAAQLASYSQSKQFLLDTGGYWEHWEGAGGVIMGWLTPPRPPGYFRDDILCHFCASMISGLVTTGASMPVDIAKTRLMSSLIN